MEYMRGSEEEEAIASFNLARETLQHVEDPKELDMTWLAIHLGCIYTIQGRDDDANKLLLTVLKNHEEAFGKDDTTSFE